MRDYGKVYATFWSSDTTGGMSDDGKLIALYLMTCSHSTIAGVFRLPDGYVSEDLGWRLERVAEGFHELSDKGFANRCETTKWVWVRKHLEWNPPENPNQRKSAAKVAAGIPSQCCWGPEFMRVYGEVLALEARTDWNGSPTVSQPLLNQKQKQKQEQKQEQKTETPRKPPKGGGERFEDFWLGWPKNERKQDKAKCLDHWKRHGLDDLADAILADVRAKRGTQKWAEGFVEAPLVYLRGKRWEDGNTEAAAADEQLGDWRATRTSVEQMGEHLGLGRWDQSAFELGRGEAFAAYERRVVAAHEQREGLPA